MPTEQRDVPLALLRKLQAAYASVPHILAARPAVQPVVQEFKGQVGPTIGKYLRYGRQIARATYLARELELEGIAPLRVLDIGTAHGYFAFVCSRMGHKVTGLDVDWTPVYNQLSEALGVDRVVHEIRGQQPLPQFEERFELITAFMLCFNGHKNKTEALWGVSEWSYLLGELKGLAAPGGARLVLSFNRERDGQMHTPELRDYFQSQGGTFSREDLFLELPLEALDAT